MKINGVNSAERLSSVYRNNKSFDSSKKTQIKTNGDKIEISNRARELSKMDDSSIDESRKIEKVKELIQKENYNVDSKKLAIAMLNYARE